MCFLQERQECKTLAEGVCCLFPSLSHPEPALKCRWFLVPLIRSTTDKHLKGFICGQMERKLLFFLPPGSESLNYSLSALIWRVMTKLIPLHFFRTFYCFEGLIIYVWNDPDIWDPFPFFLFYLSSSSLLFRQMFMQTGHQAHPRGQEMYVL